ncbi:double zinc ribbon domain-containing protein [Kiloniella litopenaei]|uniref:double zinc ribbon domain-containing protein n=1 Tax=Kiloniella litopenaei TaxID=1549748 RepID=UPI003BAC4B2B
MHIIRALLPGLLNKGVNYLFPPVCGNCDCAIWDNAGICPNCWKDLTFISGACCKLCGYPFELSHGDDLVCGECLKSPKKFDQCRAALVYDVFSKDMIIGFKHADKTYLRALFTQWLSLCGQDIINEADFIIPIPLHPRRLLKRRYNQAGLLAQGVARLHHKKYTPDLLLRTKNTSSQGQFSMSGRWRNVRNAFVLNSKFKDEIYGKHIVLIDDVYTTGATLDSCARTLKNAGASTVSAVVLARVTKE